MVELFPFMKSIGMAKHSGADPFTFLFLHPMLVWRECSIAWEEKLFRIAKTLKNN